MLTTSGRIGEALAVRVEDLEGDPETGLVLVTLSETLVYDGGKLIRQSTAKTSSSTRTVAVPVSVRQMLLLRARATRSPDGLLFATRNGTPIAPANWRRTFRAIVAGTPLEWVTPHTLRKTAATKVARELGVAAASELLGHSTQAITEAAYVERQKRVDVTEVTGQLLA